MTKATNIVAALVAVVGVVLFTILLVNRNIEQLGYLGLLTLTAGISLAIFLSSRLAEFDLKNVKLVLREIEEKKAELAEMYGGIENIKRGPLLMDIEKCEALGMDGGLVVTLGVMRYTAGVVKRERERLAQIFITGRSPKKIAEALVDGSKDDLVFKWNGPEKTLNDPPKSKQERDAEKAARGGAMIPNEQLAPDASQKLLTDDTRSNAGK